MLKIYGMGEAGGTKGVGGEGGGVHGVCGVGFAVFTGLSAPSQ